MNLGYPWKRSCGELLSAVSVCVCLAHSSPPCRTSDEDAFIHLWRSRESASITQLAIGVAFRHLLKLCVRVAVDRCVHVVAELRSCQMTAVHVVV